MKYSLFVVLLLCTSVSDVFSQSTSFIRRYVQGFITDTADISRPQFIAYPLIAYAPETNWEFGASGLYLFYSNRDTLNRLSEIVAQGFYTIENQYGGFVEHALYSNKNKWFFLGNIKFQSFPMSFYGIGIDSQLANEQKVDALQFLVKERVLRKVTRNFYAGLEFELNRYSDVSFSNPEPISSGDQLIGSEGSSNLGLGFGLLIDNRHNVLNVREGYFSELAILNYSQSLGSEYNFTSVTSDSRYFKTVRKNQVLAMQLLGQFTTGSVPFNQLPQLGGPYLMRGYYQGRFRDNNYVATQIEYRFLPLPLGFSKRIGAAVFASTGTVFSSHESLQLRNFTGSAGAGLRFLLFPKKDIFIRADYAFTREGGGFYLYIGEAF
ncbi:BamA/TamA family outer membrane protein [uncultured Algoriphagus sp.]|uniref:BamA/TamA family outer membrane protein n=1 Tax=uncultured Algoriphagus sp. TaxID=417365 RepID=UPI0030EE8E95|tara:strand:+ start:84605 stop:85741 length:1137 start_codon:yes stop_codon:yes gene_type:complete